MHRPVFLTNVIHKHAPTPITEFPDILVIIIVDSLLDLQWKTLEEEPAPHSLISHCQVISPFNSTSVDETIETKKECVMEFACLVEVRF